MKNLGTFLTVIGALGCWYFVIVYHWKTRGDWWRNPGGRHVMQFTANLGALLTLIVAARLWPDYPGRAWVTLGLFGALVVQILWRCVLLHLVQAHTAPADRVEAAPER